MSPQIQSFMEEVLGFGPKTVTQALGALGAACLIFLCLAAYSRHAVDQGITWFREKVALLFGYLFVFSVILTGFAILALIVLGVIVSLWR